MNRAAAFGRAGLTSGLVLNPQVGDLQGNAAAPVQLLAAMRATGATVLPGLLVHAALRPNEVQAVHQQAQGALLVVHRDVPGTATVAALQGLTGATHIFLDGATSVAHQGTFQQRALLRDGFAAQATNASYPPRSFFSDLHLTYAASGLVGFGDFSIVGDRYTTTGGPAYAVAIHMTQDLQAQGIYCNHFLSTSNATAANPGGKFGQAVAALAAFVQANPGAIDFSNGCQELLRHHQTGHYPGLTAVKRLSIQHHLELMAGIV